MENNKQPMTAEEFLELKGFQLNPISGTQRKFTANKVHDFIIEYRQQSSVQPGVSLEECVRKYFTIDPIPRMGLSLKQAIELYAQSTADKAVEEITFELTKQKDYNGRQESKIQSLQIENKRLQHSIDMYDESYRNHRKYIESLTKRLQEKEHQIFGLTEKYDTYYSKCSQYQSRISELEAELKERYKEIEQAYNTSKHDENSELRQRVEVLENQLKEAKEAVLYEGKEFRKTVNEIRDNYNKRLEELKNDAKWVSDEEIENEITNNIPLRYIRSNAYITGFQAGAKFVREKITSTYKQ